MKLYTLLHVFILLLSGCTHLSIPGSGGMAELKPVERFTPNKPLGPEDGVLFELEVLSKQLDALVLRGAELCYPATINMARTRENRIKRALHGGLELDAKNNMYEQHELLKRTEKRLENIELTGECSLKNSADKNAIHVMDLLPTKKTSSSDNINSRLQEMTSQQYSFIREIKTDNTKPFIKSINVKRSSSQLSVIVPANELGVQK
jgi:hypothetical protein